MGVPRVSAVARYNSGGYDEALRAVQYLKARGCPQPGVGIILGSGAGDLAGGIREAKRIPYTSIPHFARTTVAGHSGTLHSGYWGKVAVALLEGRIHLYEGYAPAEVVFPTRVLSLWGVKSLVLTCAAGGIAPQARPGRVMLISDHMNFQAANPLAGPHDDRWGARFVDMGQAYDPELRRQARRWVAALGARFFEGVYAAVLGPSYETPAEIRALRRLGADAVGMSTIPEVVAARQLGVRVMGLAIITNRAAGLSREPLSHREVLEVGKKASRNLVRFLDALMPSLNG